MPKPTLRAWSTAAYAVLDQIQAYAAEHPEALNEELYDAVSDVLGQAGAVGLRKDEAECPLCGRTDVHDHLID